MSAKYYTQFILTDTQYRGGNEFSGVIELSHPMDSDTDVRDIEAVLARNFSPGLGRDFFLRYNQRPLVQLRSRL